MSGSPDEENTELDRLALRWANGKASLREVLTEAFVAGCRAELDESFRLAVQAGSRMMSKNWDG